MPPFLPRKRGAPDDSRPAKRTLLDALDADPVATSTREEIKAYHFPGASDSSSLSDLSASDANEAKPVSDEEDDDEEDWEDAIVETTPSSATPSSTPQDLELTLDRNIYNTFTDAGTGKKGPSKIEREIRIQTHCMHVQFLLFHNTIRNAWINDKQLHQILQDQLPEGIKQEVHKWGIASGRISPPKPAPMKSKRKSKRGGERDRDWGEDASHVEPGQPDMSRGDPIIHLLRVLAAYWKKRFQITAPGLRKKGYRPLPVLEGEISSFQKQLGSEHDHGDRIKDLDEFRELARRSEGSRDTGAQLFTALLRSLDIEARMVANLQPIGFGWTKAENYRELTEKEVENLSSDNEASGEDERPRKTKPKGKKGKDKVQQIDNDLPFPIYWTEVISPVTQDIVPVDALISSNPVATTPELLSLFEPRGAKAEKAKQIIAYVVACSPDGTAKDVTTRYLKRHTWPGKAKGFRIPIEKIPLASGRGPTRYFMYDWFKVTMRGYIRPEGKRTAVDEKEDAKDLRPNQPEKKVAKAGDTLQSLRSSTEFVLERFLRREEAIRPGSQHVRTFISGKGDKTKEEKIYKRSDVERCLSAESWHKEGRRIKAGEAPLKLVPIRAVTLTRKREVEEAERETGEKQKQGLYALYQTEFIIPPPIKDGKIPKNNYGNIDCFVPTMIPKGATHIPWRGTVRVCKKLGIDYAEAVTGFEFGSKMAVPVIDGVVVASENAGLVQDAWRADDIERRRKEKLKQEKVILSTWRKFIMGLRIAERIREEYGETEESESRNPFTRGDHTPPRNPADEEPTPDEGGGFLLPGDADAFEEEDSPSREPIRQSGPEDTPPRIAEATSYIDLDDSSSELSDAPSTP
ncbi:hypothetical protein AJ80_03729 [Polytolypa hystricis UAMH7299]|uniref:Rad4 beta-hairpin domain-containing protein n=1 Tax=Polytolypa hystricis (strain UAMH7299) TaxID=1447883 RepID=A0A2B7YG75_POLH7|nr:hypothetical protein AJ80_03729 [Polytolypa hystricis UAMH7299]